MASKRDKIRLISSAGIRVETSRYTPPCGEPRPALTSALIARATSELARLIAADAVLGLAYSSEEAWDEATPVEAPRRVQRARVQRLPIPTPEPDLDDTPDVPSPQEPAADDDPEPITRAQLTALNAALTGDLGLTDRAEKLSYLSAKLGRDIGSSSEVTKAEASGLLDEIAAQPAPGVPEPAFDEPPADFVGEPVQHGNDQ